MVLRRPTDRRGNVSIGAIEKGQRILFLPGDGQTRIREQGAKIGEEHFDLVLRIRDSNFLHSPDTELDDEESPFVGDGLDHYIWDLGCTAATLSLPLPPQRSRSAFLRGPKPWAGGWD